MPHIAHLSAGKGVPSRVDSPVVEDGNAGGSATRPRTDDGRRRAMSTNSRAASARAGDRRTGAVRWPPRDRPVRPPARPLRVLDPRRGVPDPGAGAEGGGARHARRDAHRPRLDGRRDRALQGREGRRASSRSSGARSTSSTTGGSSTRATRTSRCSPSDNVGYGNLIKLCSLGYLEGYYYKPRVDWELLERHAQGMIALSGCLGGRVSRALVSTGRATPRRTSTGSPRSSAATTPTSSSRTATSTSSSRCSTCSPLSRPSAGCRWSPRATCTTSTPPTPTPTRRCSASSRATR